MDVGFYVWRWLKLFVKLSKYRSDYSFINLFCCFCVKVMRSRAFFLFFLCVRLSTGCGVGMVKLFCGDGVKILKKPRKW